MSSSRRSGGIGTSVKGLPTPVFLALAADVYADHLKRVHARLKRADERRKAQPAEVE